MKTILPFPIGVGFKLVQPIEGMQHIVKDAAREKHVVDFFLCTIQYGKLEESKATLQAPKAAFDVLSNTLQCIAPACLLYVLRILDSRDENSPLSRQEKHNMDKTRNEGQRGILSFCQFYHFEKELVPLMFLHLVLGDPTFF